ncbi:MAG TPA: FHA domain-containing protein [Polyangiales bacterium]|nr:FHA domain-containing protein [Polyangiales bacterium]
MNLQTTQLGSDSGASEASAGFRLQIVVEPFEGPIRGLTLNAERELSIGRDPQCGLQLEGRLISRKHAVVRATPDGLEVEDTSSNGTLVDGTYLRMNRRQVAQDCILVVGCVRLWLRKATAGRDVRPSKW